MDAGDLKDALIKPSRRSPAPYDRPEMNIYEMNTVYPVGPDGQRRASVQ